MNRSLFNNRNSNLNLSGINEDRMNNTMIIPRNRNRLQAEDFEGAPPMPFMNPESTALVPLAAPSLSSVQQTNFQVGGNNDLSLRVAKNQKKKKKQKMMDVEEEDEIDRELKDMGAAPAYGSLTPFGQKNESPAMNPKFYNRLLRQFGKTFLLKLVHGYNALSKQVINLDEVDDVIELIIKMRQEITKSYLYSIIFPEKCRGMRIPTKFPIPSMTFYQKSHLTITPNSSGVWYLQWCPQTLLTSSFNTANQGNLLLNNSSTLTGGTADTTATNYTSVTIDRLQSAGMIQAYRLVSASLIISYVGSVDAHAGVLGGGVDISMTDSILPDTSASAFNVIDDKIWNLQASPYEGLRLIYFPKDYNDLNFIRPDVSSQSNGLSTVIRFLVYGQNMPAGASVRCDLVRNFEGLPLPAMADFVTMDFHKQKTPGGYSKSGDPALDAGSLVAENNAVITKGTDEGILGEFADRAQNFGYNDFTDTGYSFEDEKDENHGIFGNILDIAGGLGVDLLKSTVGKIPYVGDVAKMGIDYLGQKAHKLNIF